MRRGEAFGIEWDDDHEMELDGGWALWYTNGIGWDRGENEGHRNNSFSLIKCVLGDLIQHNPFSLTHRNNSFWYELNLTYSKTSSDALFYYLYLHISKNKNVTISLYMSNTFSTVPYKLTFNDMSIVWWLSKSNDRYFVYNVIEKMCYKLTIIQCTLYIDDEFGSHFVECLRSFLLKIWICR